MAIQSETRFARLWPARRVTAGVLAVGTLALVSAGAAQAGELYGLVKELAPTVSLAIGESRPVASYSVTLKNTSQSNIISNARLVATTQVDRATNVIVEYKSTSGASSTEATVPVWTGPTCTVTGAKVDCSVGSLQLNEEKKFTLNFYSPSSESIPPESNLVLMWDAVFDNGTPPGGSNGESGEITIALSAIDTAKVTSAVPSNEEVSVFTGNLALPSNLDQFTVAIKVPSANVISTTAAVSESDNTNDPSRNCANLRNFKLCFKSEVTIPGVELPYNEVGNYLRFLLSIDKSNIRNGAKIDKTLVRYEGADVQHCRMDASGKAIPNVDKTPCIAKVYDYLKKPSPQGWFGFQWEIIGLKNGYFEIF